MKISFHKDWWQSGLKYWYIALLDMVFFLMMLYAIQFDYQKYGFSQNIYALSIIIYAYCSITFNQIFFDKVVKEMKKRGWFPNASNNN